MQKKPTFFSKFLNFNSRKTLTQQLKLFRRVAVRPNSFWGLPQMRYSQVQQLAHDNFSRLNATETPLTILPQVFTRIIDLRGFFLKKKIIFNSSSFVLKFLFQLFLFPSYVLFLLLIFMVLVYFFTTAIYINAAQNLVFTSLAYLFYDFSSTFSLQILEFFYGILTSPVFFWNLDYLFTDLPTLVQIIFQIWEDHVQSWEFFYHLDWISIYWIFLVGCVIYLFSVIYLLQFLWNLFLFRYDYWNMILRLFYGTDYLRALSDSNSVLQNFGANSLSALTESSGLFEDRKPGPNVKRFIGDYNLSLGLFGFIGFIDFFPSYDLKFNKISSHKRRTHAMYFFPNFLNFLRALRFWQPLPLKHSNSFFDRVTFRENYFYKLSAANRSFFFDINFFTVPRFKLPLFKKTVVRYLFLCVSALSYIGDLEVVRLRKKFHFFLTKGKELWIDDEFALETNDSSSFLLKDGLTNWYHRELATVVLARTISNKIAPQTTKLFNFGWVSLFNSYSFWNTEVNLEAKFSEMSEDPSVDIEENEDETNSWLEEFNLSPSKMQADNYGEDEIYFLENDPEAVISDKSEEFFFEDGFLHEDIESVLFEEDLFDAIDREPVVDVTDKNYSPDVTNFDENDFLDPDFDAVFDFASNPLLSYGAGQEEDYTFTDLTLTSNASTFNFDDPSVYSATNVFSSFYEDICDFYWLNADDAGYKNLLEYPVARFFNPLYSASTLSEENVFFSRFSGGRLFLYFTSFLSNMIIPAASRVRFDFFVSVFVGFFFINCLVFFLVSGLWFDSNWLLTGIFGFFCLHSVTILLTIFCFVLFCFSRQCSDALMQFFSLTSLWINMFLGFFFFLCTYNLQCANTYFFAKKKKIALTNQIVSPPLISLIFARYTVSPNKLILLNFNRTLQGANKYLITIPQIFNSHLFSIFLSPLNSSCSVASNITQLVPIVSQFSVQTDSCGSLALGLVSTEIGFFPRLNYIDHKTHTHLKIFCYKNLTFFNQTFDFTSPIHFVYQNFDRFLKKSRLLSHANFTVVSFAENYSAEENKNSASLYYNALDKHFFRLSVTPTKMKNWVFSKPKTMPIAHQHTSVYSKNLWSKNFEFFSATLFGENSLRSGQVYVNLLRLILSETLVSSAFTGRYSPNKSVDALASESWFFLEKPRNLKI